MSRFRSPSSGADNGADLLHRTAGEVVVLGDCINVDRGRSRGHRGDGECSKNDC